MKCTINILILGLLILASCGKQETKSSSRASSPATTAVVADACSSHAVGVNFQADDGCNTCSCRSNGSMACTQMMCTYSSLIMQAGLSH